MKGLRENGVEIKECHTNNSNMKGFLDLIKKHSEKEYDILFVGFPTYKSVPLAKLLSKIRNKPLIYDPLTSKYNTSVEDRKTVKKKSFKAYKFFYWDKISCSLPDRILIDTETHLNYFTKKFNLSKNKFRKIFIGTDDNIFFPEKPKKNNNFIVKFYGVYNSLQGVEYIVNAAKLLENYKDIKFEFLGTGQNLPYIKDSIKKYNLSNIILKEYKIPYDYLPDYISNADICLGIFGNTIKSNMVVPNKVFEALAMGKPLITQESKAIKEIPLINKSNAMLVEGANSEALAESILELKVNNELRQKIANNGYKTYKDKFTPEILGKKLKDILYELIGN